MSIRNQNWYNLQSTRRYPLDENSTGLDDSNSFIRDDILVDCHIRFPGTYGKHVYVQGLTVSPGIVTVVFGVSAETGPVSGEPLAFLSVVKPVTANVNYPIVGLKAGVSGWVAFGQGIENNFTGRYTSVQQSLVSPRCARAYKPLPVPTIGKLGLQGALQGVVKLLGELPVRVRYAADAGAVVKIIDDAKAPYKDSVQAIVVELDQTQITTDYNPLQLFLGPCAQRPESGTCPKPPIESINGVVPDCRGNINIVFENFEAVRPFADCGGVDIISKNDLPAICDALNPRKTHTTYQDDCCVAGFTVPTEADLATFPVPQRTAGVIVKTADTGERWKLEADLITWTATNSVEYCAWPDPTDKVPDIVIDETVPGPAYANVAIPACVDFSTCGGDALFTTQGGSFRLGALLSPPGCPTCVSNELDPETINSGRNELTLKNVYAAQNAGAVNIATFNNSATDWALNKTISAEIRVGAGGIERSGGVILNYQRALNDAQLLQTTFVAVVLDASRGQLRVLRYTDNSITVESTATMPVSTESWYRVSVTPINNGSTIALNVYAEKIAATNRVTANMVVQIAAAAYGPLVGAAGIIASRSYAWFNKFTIIE